MPTGIGHTSRKCHSKPEPVPCCSPSKECQSCAVATQRFSPALLCGWNFSLQNGSPRPPVAIEADEINENSEVDPVAACASHISAASQAGLTRGHHAGTFQQRRGHCGSCRPEARASPSSSPPSTAGLSRRQTGCAM